MILKLRESSSPEPNSPFSWDKVPVSPQPSSSAEDAVNPPSPPTQWLSARDMKVFGASPLKSTVGLVKCKDCEKPVLRSAMAEHAGEQAVLAWLAYLCACCSPALNKNMSRSVLESAECRQEEWQRQSRHSRWVLMLPLEVASLTDGSQWQEAEGGGRRSHG
jgi:hypothetical protein